VKKFGSRLAADGLFVWVVTAIFSASKPQIPVGAKHDRRQIMAENINLNTVMLRPTLATDWQRMGCLFG
jgi:hypothetical protein